MRVAMIGTGYVGLVSGACFADFGHVVTCIDKDAAKIARLKDGVMPIFEPGLDTLVARNVREDRLFFDTNSAEAVRDADAVFIAVGTPSRRGDGHADLSYVYAAAEEIAGQIEGFTVVVTKSTVPVGTGDEIEAIIRRVRPDADVAVVSNPEFLREGAAINDFKRPDRVVVGIEDERARAVMSELYRPLNLNETPILFTGRRTSELTKYAANAFLAMKITFINEVADLCEVLGADVQQIARGIGLDNRIGSKFLHAGPGYGGSCFPKDTLALVRTAADAGSPIRLVETTVEVNDARKKAMAGKVVAGIGEDRRRAGPDLQTQYRRHARRSQPGYRTRAAGHGRQDPSLRPRGPRGAPDVARCRVHGRPLRGRGRRRRPGHPDGVGSVPCPRPDPHSRSHGPTGRHRPAQHLSAGGNEGERL